MKLSARIAVASFAVAALVVLVGTIWVATSGDYTPTPTIIGAGVTIGLAFAAWTVWREGHGR